MSPTYDRYTVTTDRTCRAAAPALCPHLKSRPIQAIQLLLLSWPVLEVQKDGDDDDDDDDDDDETFPSSRA